MYQAISTKYLGPTNSRGARVKAQADAGQITISWDHRVGIEKNHCRAAKAFAEKMQWGGRWYGGYVAGGGYVFVSTRDQDMKLGEDCFVIEAEYA